MSDKINHPSHYNQGKIEVIDFIEDCHLDFHEGNVIKYICRAKYKEDELENLKKAQWYLERLIEKKSLESEERRNISSLETIKSDDKQSDLQEIKRCFKCGEVIYPHYPSAKLFNEFYGGVHCFNWVTFKT